MALDDRIRDRMLHRATRLVRAGNGVANQLGPYFAEMSLRWAVRTTQIIHGEIVAPDVALRAQTYAVEVIEAGYTPYDDAYTLIEEGIYTVGKIYHDDTVTMLRKELARTVKEEVTRDELANGSAILPMSDEMTEVVRDLTINGDTMAELRDIGTLRQAEALKRVFRLAAIEGWRPHRLTNEVAAVADVSRQGAERIARTGIMRISNEVNRRLYLNNRDIVKAQEYVATLDARTCLICAADDRRHFRLGEGPAIPRHPLCRCVYTPVTKTWRELGVDADEISPKTRAAMEGPEHGETSFTAWIRRQDKATQLDVLGPARYELFQSGTPIRAFVDDGRILSLDKLRQKGIGG